MAIDATDTLLHIRGNPAEIVVHNSPALALKVETFLHGLVPNENYREKRRVESILDFLPPLSLIASAANSPTGSAS